ncbi:ATP-binding protein [Streptomyces sudanensis]|uniref:ATP-binding protein n=1 Tax=Streptomyces sudanensis TaxID=436397 RepID=UPI0020CDF48C|nr:ATP-binding protein [Streptomyces sudanensis]MCP9959639.1 ATP-binding protein [Streptomyces sudanensis]MCP9999929.1 ATP-binding protein [Streptomyces sudanensis]
MIQQSVTVAGEPSLAAPHFRVAFPTSRRGAHVARRAAERWLADRRDRPEGAVGDEEATTASLLVAELTANAALHGRVRGRHARLTLTLTAGTLRIEVTDARGDRLPAPTPDADGESGRGLLLVASLADAWGCEPHDPGGKTVWAECARHGPAPKGGA